MKNMTIGQVAAIADVKVDTLRYYEKLGLIEEPMRGPNGYRQYSEQAVKRFLFIRRAKAVGFALRARLKITCAGSLHPTLQLYQ